jgi:hypothetical protein
VSINNILADEPEIPHLIESTPVPIDVGQPLVDCSRYVGCLLAKDSAVASAASMLVCDESWILMSTHRRRHFYRMVST